MGEVYLGVHPEIGSQVAIKVLLDEYARDTEHVERFFAEARAVNLIRHESIVSVLDLATLPDGRPYIVMEYLQGAPLSRLLESESSLPLGGITRLLLEVLAALRAAHDAGITHRDLKPDNIYVTQSGRAKVLDFGIAKLKPELRGGGNQTRTGALLGTPLYMSPEQARGQRVDARSDLYSVGVILFECTTGRRPFQASSLYDLLKAHIEQQPPRPSSLRTDLPAAYEVVILRALEKEPWRRYQSAAEFAAALHEAAQCLPAESWTTLVPAGSKGAPFDLGPRAVSSGQAPTAWEGSGTMGTPPAVAHTRKQPTTAEAVRQRKWPLFALLGLAAAGLLGLLIAGVAVLSGGAVWMAARGAQIGPGSELELDNPRRVDPSALLEQALVASRREVSDAELATFTSTDVRADGTVDVTGRRGIISYVFGSRGGVAGETTPEVCYAVVSVALGMARVTPMGQINCGDMRLVRPPRCSTKQVMERTGFDRANLTYTFVMGGPGWLVASGADSKVVDDDC
jgi:hypothetical protein